MNAVYIRMAIYALAPVLLMLPGVTYDSIAQTLLIDLETAAIGLSASLAGVAGVFAIWGKK